MDKKTSLLVKACLKKAHEKLSSSAWLAKTKSYDDAVSRAYYAAFYAAQAKFIALPIKFLEELRKAATSIRQSEIAA